MADNGTGLNAQYGASQFGLDTSAYASTGAAGSPVPGASETYGPVVGTPVVSVPGASSQVPANMPRIPVTAGDTNGMSADAPVPPSGDPLTGLSLADVTLTGAGEGSHITAGHHPNSMSGGR